MAQTINGEILSLVTSSGDEPLLVATVRIGLENKVSVGLRGQHYAVGDQIELPNDFLVGRPQEIVEIILRALDANGTMKKEGGTSANTLPVYHLNKKADKVGGAYLERIFSLMCEVGEFASHTNLFTYKLYSEDENTNENDFLRLGYLISEYGWRSKFELLAAEQIAERSKRLIGQKAAISQRMSDGDDIRRRISFLAICVLKDDLSLATNIFKLSHAIIEMDKEPTLSESVNWYYELPTDRKLPGHHRIRQVMQDYKKNGRLAQIVEQAKYHNYNDTWKERTRKEFVYRNKINKN